MRGAETPAPHLGVNPQRAQPAEEHGDIRHNQRGNAHGVLDVESLERFNDTTLQRSKMLQTRFIRRGYRHGAPVEDHPAHGQMRRWREARGAGEFQCPLVSRSVMGGGFLAVVRRQ